MRYCCNTQREIVQYIGSHCARTRRSVLSHNWRNIVIIIIRGYLARVERGRHSCEKNRFSRARARAYNNNDNNTSVMVYTTYRSLEPLYCIETRFVEKYQFAFNIRSHYTADYAGHGNSLVFVDSILVRLSSTTRTAHVSSANRCSRAAPDDNCAEPIAYYSKKKTYRGHSSVVELGRARRIRYCHLVAIFVATVWQAWNSCAAGGRTDERTDDSHDNAPTQSHGF